MASGAVQRRDAERVQFTGYDAAPATIIEIIVEGATIRVGADVAEEQLARVIRAVRSA